MLHILLIEDNQGERIVELNADSGSIGRDPRNSIVLYSPEVSRQHAILLRVLPPGETEHLFQIIDGNLQGHPSTNGLFVNGNRVESHTLRHGDRLMFGAHVEASYLTADDATDINLLKSNSPEALDYMSTLSSEKRDEESIEPELKASLSQSVLARLASFPELFFHPIIEVTLDGKITYLNPAAIEQFPSIVTDVFDHPALSGVVEAVKRSSAQQMIREVLIDDRVFEQSLSYIPQSDLIRSYLVEVTDRKQAEEQLKALHSKLENEVAYRTYQFNEAKDRLKREEQALVASHATNRALINAIPDPMFRINHKGYFVNYKAPKKHTLPFKPAECLNLRLNEVFPDAIANRLETCITAALNEETIQVLEFQLSKADDSQDEIDFEARIAVSAPNEVMVIIRDITERKRGEAEIRRALERERELNEMKTKFVSITSHEFRTPLTTILSSTELLERYRDQWDDEKQLVFLNKIQTATRHMTELLDDVLLLNKAEAGKVEFNPEPLLLEEFCRNITDELQLSTQSHQIVLRSQLPRQPALIDRKLMRHIVSNLVSNAINYSPDGGQITVELDCQTGPDRETTAVLKVQDNGIGIPEESKAALFESFVRGSNVDTISGTGLGLSIVQRSVIVHEGEIDFESQVGKGTTFTVKFPLMLQPEPAVSNSQAAIAV